ncbi:hypothetical protein NST74_21565 [Paenibacillus sp. FSL F4-0125]|uniref:hypothetical protein n=1 Tax=Paenibacillus sp. FSL F4-0125 TaxID=2954730 RepID=UPI0030F93FD1
MQALEADEVKEEHTIKATTKGITAAVARKSTAFYALLLFFSIITPMDQPPIALSANVTS